MVSFLRDSNFSIAVIVATFLMGSSFVAGKILLEGGFSPMILVGWRFLLAAAATLPLVYLDSGNILAALIPPCTNLRTAVFVVMIGLVQTAAVMGLLFLAMQSISASTAAILLFTSPIWVTLLGRVFFGESLYRDRIVGLAFGVAGVALAIGLDAHSLSSADASRGELFGLLSAFCWAGATIINKRAHLPLTPWVLSFWQMLIGAFALLGMAYGHGEHWPVVMTTGQWGWFLWLAIPASTGSFGLWFFALTRGEAGRTSSYLFLAPLFSVILSFFVLGTTLTWLQACGGILIGIALWLVNRPPRLAEPSIE